jgi:hypothetical protein
MRRDAWLLVNVSRQRGVWGELDKEKTRLWMYVPWANDDKFFLEILLDVSL